MFIVIFLTKNYFKQYQAFHEGSCPSAKHRENAFSKVSRIRSFLAFMAGKDSSLATWRFLDKAEQIIQWPNVLAASGKNITTANFYLRNVLQFMIYFKETPPKLARLSQSQITGVIRAVRQAVKSIAKKMLAHQLTTKDKKLSKVVSQESLRRCQLGARKAIPKLLKELREDYTVQLRNAFYGYYSAFIASIYGHRPGVFKIMTVAEVRGAATEGRPPTGYVIRVNEHKTSKDFGPAQIFLEPEEYGWLLKWLQVRETCNPAGDRVFFTPGKGPLKNLVRYMQEAWAEMGLPGKPTFIDLRTAVSTHVRFCLLVRLSSFHRSLLLVCHSLSLTVSPCRQRTCTVRRCAIKWPNLCATTPPRLTAITPYIWTCSSRVRCGGISKRPPLCPALVTHSHSRKRPKRLATKEQRRRRVTVVLSATRRSRTRSRETPAWRRKGGSWRWRKRKRDGRRKRDRRSRGKRRRTSLRGQQHLHQSRHRGGSYTRT
uniref:uncharacterized protein LOC109953864 n=1 Tax=Monopterus albus TaxID=43700 RepID=UPI0009B3DA0A|nr:uncharacterized protein LOC109953864 [Monopterus albus]